MVVVGPADLVVAGPPVLGLADLVVELLLVVVDQVVIRMVMGIRQGCNPPVRDHHLHCR